MVSFRLSNKTGGPPAVTLPSHLMSPGPFVFRCCSLASNVRDRTRPQSGRIYGGASCRSRFQVFSFFFLTKVRIWRRVLIDCSLFVAFWILYQALRFPPVSGKCAVMGRLPRRYCCEVRGRDISVTAGPRVKTNTQTLLSVLCWKLIIFGQQNILGKKNQTFYILTLI